MITVLMISDFCHRERQQQCVKFKEMRELLCFGIWSSSSLPSSVARTDLIMNINSMQRLR